jgi:hypothetical protein
MIGFLGTGCAKATIPLEYHYVPGRTTNYLWTIESNTSIDTSTDHSVKQSKLTVAVRENVDRAGQVNVK